MAQSEEIDYAQIWKQKLDTYLTRLDLHDRIIDELLVVWSLYGRLPLNAERTHCMSSSKALIESMNMRRAALSKETLAVGAAEQRVAEPSRIVALDRYSMGAEAVTLCAFTAEAGTEAHQVLRTKIKESDGRLASLMGELKGIENTLPEKPIIPLGYIPKETQSEIMDRFLDFLEENNM